MTLPKKVYQDTPAHYIKEKRLEKGRELLEVTDFSVGEIAFLAGFNDPGYFSKSFQERYRSSPSEYRKQISKKLY